MPWSPDTISSDQVNDLRQAAEQAWGEDTRYEGYIGHPQPSAGQCYVTANWLTQRLGGYVGSKDGHFFWVSPDKRNVIDLTGDLFAHPPVDPSVEGQLLDEDDEPWELDPHQKTWRPGPAMYKRSDHPLYKGFRVVEPNEDHQRSDIFARRAEAAMRGGRISSFHKADLMGPSGLQTPQEAENWDMGAPMMHDVTNPVLDMTTHEYKWVFANGQMHVSPSHAHEELFDHAGFHPESNRPAAVGFVTVSQSHALWEVEANVSMRGLHKILSDYSDTVGWKFDGMVGTGGEHLHDDFGPKKSMYYTTRKDGHLVMAETPLPHGRCIQIVGKTAYTEYANEGLKEWANDFGYKLAEFPGGGDMTDKMKVREHLDTYNRGDTDFQPERDNPDQDLGDSLTCGGCGVKFNSLAALRLHHRDHEPKEEEIQDGHFPQIDDFDAPLPFRRTQPFPNWGETISRTVVMPLPNHHMAGRHPRFDLYASLFNYAHDDKLRFYGAFRQGQLVGYGAIRLNSESEQWFDEQDVRDHVRSLGTGETDDDLESLVPETDYYRGNVDPSDLNYYAVDPAKARAIADSGQDLAPIVVTASGLVTDGNHRAEAARLRGEQVPAFIDQAWSPGNTKFYSRFEPEVLMIDAAVNGTGIGTAILGLMQTHFDKFYTHADSKAGERLMRRLGMVNVDGHRWRWAKGEEPKDMIEAAIPFVYDIQGDDQHKDGYIKIGYPGERTSDISGRFTPGGIVEGYYEPGGKIILISTTNVPYTVNFFARLWYHQYPQMEITSIETEDGDGKTEKLAAEEGYMYHVAPSELREQIQSHGLAPKGRGFTGTEDPWLTSAYGMQPVFLSHEPGRSTDTRYDTTGRDVWRVNTQGLPLVADLPGLYDNGASFPEDPTDPDEGIWYEGGRGDWNTPMHPWVDEENTIPIGDLLDSAHPLSQAAIQTTGTAAHMGAIPPDRLQLVQRHEAKLASGNVGPYLKTMLVSNQAAYNADRALAEAGGKRYIVGGAVRDALQGRSPEDLDLLVAGLPSEKVAHILSALPGRVDLTGKRFGVYRYKVGGEEVEIALPRQDKYETSRRGEGVITVDHHLPVDKDLERRDFTANSMAVDLDSGQLIDPHGGEADIAKNVLRTTHPDSFQEDPTRIVRALAAHGRFGLIPDERTRQEMVAHGHMLRSESPDSLNKVLDKTFTSHNPAAAIRLAHETQVLPHLFPEVAQGWDYNQNNPHHSMRLGEHSLHVLDNTSRLTTDPDVRMAALYHDVGKPASEWRDPATGVSHYYQGPEGLGADHAVVGAKMLEDRMRALNYPVARIRRTTDLVANHMFPAFDTPKGARKFLQRVSNNADDLLTLRQADMEGKGVSTEADASQPSVDKMRELVDQARRAQAPTDIQNLAINGNDLIGMGMQPGPALGNTLRALVDHVVDVPTDNTPERLKQLAQGYMQAQPE